MIVPGRSLVSAGTGLQCTAVSRAVCDTSLKSWLVCEGLVVVLSEMKVQMAQTVVFSHFFLLLYSRLWEASEGNIFDGFGKNPDSILIQVEPVIQMPWSYRAVMD